MRLLTSVEVLGTFDPRKIKVLNSVNIFIVNYNWLKAGCYGFAFCSIDFHAILHRRPVVDS